jgi:hypothetical protein
MAFDTDSLRPIVSAEIPLALHAQPGVFAVAPRPEPPVVQAPVVSGGDVWMVWSPVASAAVTTRHLLDVGSGPGRSDILSALEIGPQTSFNASGVPPGVYYVRVRAGNYSGLSSPSNEVVVVVQ